MFLVRIGKNGLHFRIPRAMAVRIDRLSFFTVNFDCTHVSLHVGAYTEFYTARCATRCTLVNFSGFQSHSFPVKPDRHLHNMCSHTLYDQTLGSNRYNSL